MAKKVLMVVFCVFMVAICGCEKKAQPKDVVTNFFAALKSGDYAAADAMMVSPIYGTMDKNELELISYYYRSMNIMESTIELASNSAYADVTVDSIDLAAVMQIFGERVFAMATEGESAVELDDAKLDSMLREVLNSEDLPRATEIIEVSLALTDGVWKIAMVGNAQKSADAANADTGFQLLMQNTSDWIYVTGDKTTGVCSFTDADNLQVIALCSPEHIDFLDAGYKDKNITVTYNIYGTGADSDEFVLEIVDFVTAQEETGN